MGRTTLVAALLATTAASRTVYLLNNNWRFELLNGPAPQCADPTGTFPIDLNNTQCFGLTQVTSAQSLGDCINACCADSSCATYQWCEGGSCSPQASCWIGAASDCQAGSGWISAARNVTPPAPNPGRCADAGCAPGTNDTDWRLLNLPHDFVVEGNFSESADKSHGYLPYGTAWYRKHLTIPTAAAGATIWLEFEGIQTTSSVWLNGWFVGAHASGYTASTYFLNASTINFGGDNVLAVYVDCTQPDGWWYDGGGIYRNVWLTVVDTPGAYISQWGVYAASAVTGPITWNAYGDPSADAAITPSVEVWNNATMSQAFTVDITVFDASSNTVGTASGSGSVPGATVVNGTVAAGVAMWNVTSSIALTDAALWHLVAPPATPALYTLTAVLSVDGAAVDSVTVTFGIRETKWDGATGFYLNGINTKILGNANHQDLLAVGVAVPDVLQLYRISKLKEFGGNGWRTAHNPPNPALLDAADTLGFLVWDENHRNGQDDQIPLLVKRDRNHPSVVIWSLCNEVLCETSNTTGDALRLKALVHSLDPLGGRPVSANYNPFIGPNTPLDVQGFDYATSSYDGWHQQAPNIPSISSETSSAVSDRDEYFNNATAGIVSGYDVNAPGWGQTAEGAWGGIGISNNQGILTRPFISGGWTWTGWDYRGEPTPYAWPDVNSHFGIVDLASFPKDRFFWYQSWFAQPSPPTLHLFPHWNWADSGVDAVDVWVFSNADEVELFVNGVSAGRKPMPRYAHIEWDAVPFVPGTLQAVAYVNGTAEPVAVAWRNTTGTAAALRIGVRDGVGAQMMAGCNDAAIIEVAVIDAAGAVVPTASNVVTFTVDGPATFAGSANGDPAGLVNNKSPVRPVWHGLASALVLGGTTPGTVTVTASSPGFRTVTVDIPQLAPAPSFSAFWCHTEPTL